MYNLSLSYPWPKFVLCYILLVLFLCSCLFSLCIYIFYISLFLVKSVSFHNNNNMKSLPDLFTTCRYPLTFCVNFCDTMKDINQLIGTPQMLTSRYTLLYLSDAQMCCVLYLQCLSVVPLEIFRWVIAGVAGFMSATFVALNLRAHIKSAGERWFLIVASIFLLQLALAVILKLYLFTVTV